ncbi:MAG TPA: SGNH/GDSL hydrolase family protein [Fimbriimonadaceae bacterium]|jgi:lysophospholipase L1-like esterase
MIPLLAAAFALHSGDTVLFYGDSITQQQLYTVYVEDFVRTRYPNLKVRFYNRGWGGDKVTGGAGGDAKQRVTRDVKPIDPTVITVMLGMNDGQYAPYEPKTFNIFNQGYGKLLSLLHENAPRARFTLIQTSPYDNFAHTHPDFSYNDALLQYGAAVKSWAEKDQDEYVDFNKPVVDMLKGAFSADPAGAPQIISDSIHPGPAGHLVMAAALVRDWGADPTVAGVELDSASQTVTHADRTTITGFDGFKWNEKDDALPFAIDLSDHTVQLAVMNSEITKKLNQETLKISHLITGYYELMIDGVAMGRFSAESLSTGVNLANYDTPMHEQAMQVLDLVTRCSHIDFTKWREIEIEEASIPSVKQASGALEKLENDIFAAEMAAAQPKTHKFELRPVS